MMPRISEKIKSVQTRLAEAANNGPVPQLVAVSKTRTSGEIREAAGCGLIHFGENYLQEALTKIQELEDLTLVWHFIGTIQSNKTAEIAQHFQWVHTLDRIKIARRLSEQRPDHLPPLNLLIQINIDAEDSKSGIDPADLTQLSDELKLLPRIKLRGLMAIPKPRHNFQEQLAICQLVKSYYALLKQRHAEVDTLSLGMSSDLEAAVRAGSTMVRIGTDIFGTRS